jgi:spore germination protein GerM
MMDAFTDALQFIIFADFVGALSLGKLLANTGKRFKSVLAQKETVDYFRMILPDSQRSIQAADRKFVSQSISHDKTVYNKTDNCYHIYVAVRKTTRKTAGKTPESQIVVIFWLVFVIVIIAVFMINSETIKRNFNILKTRLSSPPNTEEEMLEENEPEQTPEPIIVTVVPPPNQTGTQVEQGSPASQTTLPPQPPSQGTTTNAEQMPTQAPVQTPVQVRERNVYFAQVDKDGQILQSRVTRRIPVSDSPLVDALNVMLTGPTADELNRGILNLIPKNTKILSATVRGSTAYISFSEDFLFNTFGVEGYVAQLRQIVWTVTEFSNVNDVQVLIEGRRLDYLGEGIWIGSPIGRLSF